MKMFRKMKGKLGFTLAEMLIVVAIIAILTAVAAPNVAKYSRGVKLRELDDSARAIYMAAEHKFMNEIEMGRELPKGTLVDGSIDTLDNETVKKRYGDEANDMKVVYLRSDGDGLQKLKLSGGAGVENTGVVESQLFSNKYIVEYRYETGDVLGVFYTETDDEIFSDYLDENYYPDIDELQKEHLIGYYGSDNVKPEEKTNSEVLPKPEVTIINKEKLVLKIHSDSQQYVAIEINEKPIIDRKSIYLNGDVEIILDSLTTGTSGKSTLPSENGQLQPKYEDTIANWLDGTGLTIDGSDMTLTVTFYDPEGKTRDQSVTKTFNPLFASGSKAGTAYIEYGRHLQNLDKCSAVTTAVIKRTIDFSKTGLNEYESWASTYPGKKFVSLPFSSINISAVSGAEIRNIDFQGVDVYDDGTLYSGLFTWFSGEATNLVFRNPKSVGGSITGTLCGYGISTVVNNVTVINPKIECNNSGGGLIGMDSESVISNCAVYVAEDENYSWGDPNNDPYYHYTIVAENTDNYSGGLVGLTTLTTIKESYAAVKVSCEKGKAGGLVGFCSSETFIENSFSAGHTYYGIFEGNAKDGKEINLKDNVRGNIAGGIVSESQGDNEINIIGTVFSTCSVSGTTVDLAYNGTAVIKDGATVYTLGTAYLPDGTKTTKSSDERVKTGDEVKLDDSSATVGMRYDLKVSSAYKYPVPAGMTMHGDWPSSDAVTGFFYWEKEDKSGTDSYAVSALWYGKGQPEVLLNTLCSAQDGNNITEYGYGAFTVGGSLDGSAVTFTDGTCTDVEDAGAVSAIQTALAGAADLNVTDPTTITVKLYSVTTSSDKPLVKATVGGNEYTFAPDFYAIYASKDSVSVGTAEGVLGVRSEAHLAKVGSYLSEKFVQSHDIKPAAALTPIGTSAAPFTGAYDGGSYRIINAAISSNEASDYAGLFGRTDGAELENIVMFNEAATADDFKEIRGKTVGVIVGEAAGAGSINNCVAAGYTVIGSENSGGIAGASACAINNCEANIKFNNVTKAVGGIAGSATGDVINCYALVHDYVGSLAQVGGIVGGGASGKVDNCYSMFKGMYTTGRPIADHTDGHNIYVVDSGFCPKTSKIPNANDKPVEIEDLGLELKDSKNAVKTYVSDAINYAEKNEFGAYSYLAVVTDKDGNFVHYGPTPIPGSKGQLVTGPIAGIFNFRGYSYYNNENVGQFDGLISYVKHNQIFYDEKVISNNIVKETNGEPKQYVGIFLEKAANLYDGSIKIVVNGETIEPSNIKLLEEAFMDEYGKPVQDNFLQNNGTYDFKNEDGLIDGYTHNGEDYVKDLIKRFNFYFIIQNGKIRQFVETDSIEIWYINPKTDIEGILVKAKGTSTSPVHNTGFFSELPEINYDMNKFPKVGMFSLTRPNDYCVDNEHYLFVNVQGQRYGKEGNDKINDAIMGILVEESRIEDIPEGRINVTLDKVFYELEPLDDIIKEKGMTIVNDYEINMRGYKAYAFVDVKPEALWKNRDIVIYYGTNDFAYFDQTFNMTGPAAAFDAGNEYSEREEAEWEDNKKKIGLAITWEDDSGNKTTKVKFSDETVIGTTSGYKNVKFSIMISNDLDWTKLKAYIVNNNNYSDRKISTIINPESLVPNNSSDFDEFKSKYGGYKFYSVEGDIYVDSFEMVISYDGREILKSSKF